MPYTRNYNGKDGAAGMPTAYLHARITRLTFAGLLAGMMVAGPSVAQDVAVATATRIVGDSERTRFVVDLSDKVTVRTFALSNPYRVIIDLPQTRFDFPRGTGVSGRGLISQWRFGQFAAGKSRIVLDIENPARIDEAFVIPATDNEPARLVVNLTRISKAEFSRILANPQQREAMASASPSSRKGDRLPVAPGKKTRPMVVIDPGHGGLDTGAVGRGGLVEKDLVLRFAGILRDQLKATGHYDVHMTRSDDTFLPLRKRVRIARDLRADLFISVHADSVREKTVRGASIYTLSEKASDRTAAALAAKENRSDIIAGLELEDEPRDVTDILIDLTRRETKNFSIHFARTLIEELRGTTRLIRNTHRSAGFIVLRAHDVPSVLLELGYLSNKKDEGLLGSQDWMEKMAGEVALAVRSYFGPRFAAGAQKN